MGEFERTENTFDFAGSEAEKNHELEDAWARELEIGQPSFEKTLWRLSQLR